MVTAQNIMQEIRNIKNWKKTHKKSYEVYVCRPSLGAKCTNRLEGTNYVTDQNKQFIISGTVGETWVIDVNKLAKTYTFADGEPITPDTLSRKCDNNGVMDWWRMKTRADADNNFAFFLPKSIQNFPVKTSWGDTLLANRPGIGHGYGDFLVCTDDGTGRPNLNDVWVVNGEVFPRTYDLHGFPNMFSDKITQASTPKPQTRYMGKVSVTTELDKVVNILAKELTTIGHRVGKKTEDSIEVKSFSMDNGQYSVIVQSQDGDFIIGLLQYDGYEECWTDMGSWYKSEYSIHDIVGCIHNLTAKKKTTNKLPSKTYLEKMHNIVRGMAKTLNFTSVKKEYYGEYSARITIDRAGSTNYAVIDFDEDCGDGVAQVTILDEESNDIASTKVNVNDANSVKNALKFIHVKI